MVNKFGLTFSPFFLKIVAALKLCLLDSLEVLVSCQCFFLYKLLFRDAIRPSSKINKPDKLFLSVVFVEDNIHLFTY